MKATYPRATMVIEVLFDDLKDGTGTELHSFVVVPRDVEVNRNHHREADTFSATVDWLDFPIDPRTARSIRVTVWMGDVQAPNAALNLDDAQFRAFIGYVDEPETSLEEGGETVRLSGRDQTSLFLDYTWPGRSIDITPPLEQVVRGIVQAVPGAAPLPVEFTDGAGLVRVADALGKTKYTPQAKDDAWTVLVEICGKVGLIPVVDLDRLVIRTPRQVEQRSIVAMYGRDLSRLVFRRKFNEVRTQQVVVLCWDAQNAISREAKYPPRPIITRKKVGADGKVSTETAPQISWYVQGSFSEAQLAEIARSVYEDIARDQVDGTLETAEMWDANGTALWLLANGDRVDVRLGAGDYASILAMSDTEAMAALTSGPRGMAADVARALVAAHRRADRLATSFYVRRAQHKWSCDDGYALVVDFATYVGTGGR
jgi:hypothetical protein